MASLKPIIEEIDIINEKLERMRNLFAEIRKDYDTLPDCAAQQSVYRTALLVRILNAICYGITAGTLLWLLFGSR